MGTDTESLEATAQSYDDLLAPALFQPLAAIIAEAAMVEPGASVLDVGCGSGALTRELAKRAGDGVVVAGLDANPGMLAVAGRNLPTIDFHHGDAAALPFDDNAFDTVASQFALMLFDDRLQSIIEMWRVLAPGGRLTVAVFDGLGNNKAYGTIAETYEKRVGQDIANALRYPFSMGDVNELTSLFAKAGVAPVNLTTVRAPTSFSSATHLAHSDIDGWFPFAGFAVSPEDANAIVADLATAFAEQTATDGKISFEVHAHIVSAIKP